MAERPIGVTDVASGAGVAQFRTRERTVGGETVVEQYLVPTSERVVSCRCMCTTFRKLGTATANLNHASLFNNTGSGVIVAVRQLQMAIDKTGAADATVRSTIATRITTAPTGGTLMTPTPFDTTSTQNATVEFRGATASDGGAAAVLTATPGSRLGTQLAPRTASVVRQRRIVSDPTVEELVTEDDPVYLAEGEGLLVTVVEGSTNTHFYIVSAVWGEVTFP